MADSYETISAVLEDSYEILAVRNACPITAAAFLNVIADLFATLLLSNSKLLARHTYCILRTTAGEKIASFLCPALAIEQEYTPEDDALALHKSPLRRCMTLANYSDALESRPQKNGISESPRQFSKADIDALQIVNIALQNMSDENDLAVLRFCSARELRWASEITQCSDTTIGAVSKNHRHFDFTLALQGYALGERYACGATNTEIQAWICLLSEAGAAHSVSLSS